jgi:NAD(P)-dependent dehydrogenase (short-subunit alcohol dehydrogenase family)
MTGKVAIVTGGASGISLPKENLTKGIGLALANDLHSKGWKVAIIDMNTSQGEEAVSKLGKESAIFIKADVSKWEENVSFFKTVKQKFGRIDFGTPAPH